MPRRVLALALAAVFICAPERAAHASLFDCFKTLAPLDEAKAAAAVAAKAGSCSAEGTSDPVMAMTIAALTAAAVGGAFSTVDECNTKINGQVGKLVAGALLTLPLPDAAKSLLQAYVAGTSPLTLEEIVAPFPGINAVPGYIHCGCAVAGAPGEFAEIAKEYAQTAKSCSRFFSDAANTIKNAFGDFAVDVHDYLQGPSLKPGIQMQTECYVQYLPDGIWTTTKIMTSPDFQCDVIRCPEGHVVVEGKNSAGKAINKCDAKCPDPVDKFDKGGTCYWTAGWAVEQGTCKPTQETHCCGTGQKVFEWGRCSPACTAGTEYWDTKADKCRRCQTGWHAIYQSPDSSVGSCTECPAGQTFSAATNKCVPLRCEPLGHPDPHNPHRCDCGNRAVPGPEGNCQPCGDGRIARAGQCIAAPSLQKRPTFPTPPNISKTLQCPPGLIPNAARNACVRKKPTLQCPPGTIPNAAHTVCLRKTPLQLRSLQLQPSRRAPETLQLPKR
jgi:hypothetical protein